MTATAILFAPNGAATGSLRGLVERLVNSNIGVTTFDQLDALAAAYDRPGMEAEPPCVLVDFCALEAGELDDWKRATETIKKLVALLPRAMPIVVTDGANANLILACIRAGAADVIELELEGTGVARAIVQRVWQKQAERVVEASTTRALRSMVEELVKDLVRTERRSIDLEDRAEMRPPAILLVEHDRRVADELADLLEAAGVATYAYVSGEQALQEARKLSTKTGLDLALVAAQLPGIDGLETIRRLRDLLPGLDAFLVTSVDDADLAAEAADLGVVGFVHKPLADVAEVVSRLGQLAREALQRAREALYVERIKTRHERVLARYRALPREP